MLASGLIVLHGNRLEELLAAVGEWLREQPLAPLEEEVLLVQSQGMGEWVRMQLAEREGISAALRIELPARFLWRAYRDVLGAEAVPARSPLDKAPLVWRLMAHLPAWLEDAAAHPTFAPLRRFLHEPSPARRLQLAQRLADLFDQYQVHRGDWLQDWSAGRDVLRRLPHRPGDAGAVPADDAWQPALWRALLATLPEGQGRLARSAVHEAFLQRLGAAGNSSAGWPGALPRRLVVFGTTHVPQQSLEAIAELARGSQVLMAVPNPCRHYWADLIADRDLLTASRRRQRTRPDMPGGERSLIELAPHGHPLLAGWGRQARDFIRLLDHHDDVQLTRERFGERRIDFFDEGGLEPGAPWLHQVQARIRELVPVGEAPPLPLADTDRSIVFHVAHHAHREVEILHDQLLQLLAVGTATGPLTPREVVVMVPDIAQFEPAIRAVFGQHERTEDSRHVPYRIADLRDRGRAPLLLVMEWLLGARTERFTLSGLRALLEVPAVQARFGWTPADLPLLVRWLEQSGIRWGLHVRQRASLGLAAAQEQNTWLFGLRRLLLGYALGEGEFAGIEACPEVGGLEAAQLGPLADLVEAIAGWWELCLTDRTPAAWAEVLRALRETLFDCRSPAEQALSVALDDALARWLEACQVGGFEEAVDLEVVREAWLDAVDDPGVPRRFRGGGVTFCTLLPLRAVPFRVVCLLGMNDADYPRRMPRADFDLMARTGLQRPGDRSARDDDRQLMLDALLSAREVLHVSWSGRSQRDDSEQPPSVLVAQLRDYLAQVWGRDAVAARTTVHPLQPFSRRYFTAGSPQGLFTYAREWAGAYRTEAASPEASAGVGMADDPGEPRAEDLVRFLKNPVREFCRHRLKVRFDEIAAVVPDEEPFAASGLESWRLVDEVLQAVRRRWLLEDAAAAPEPLVRRELARLARAGRLPLGAAGMAWCEEHSAVLVAMLEHGRKFEALGETVMWQASRIADSRRRPDPAKLVEAWVRLVLAARDGSSTPVRLIALDGALSLAPLAGTATAERLVAAWREGVAGERPLPTALRVGLRTAEGKSAAAAYEDSFGPAEPEAAEAALSRWFPDFASLERAGVVQDSEDQPPVSRLEYWSRCLYGELLTWARAQPTVEPYAGSLAAAGGEDD